MAKTNSAAPRSPRPLFLSARERKGSRPIWIVHGRDNFAELAQLSKAQHNWLQATGYVPKPGHHAIVPDADGGIAGIVFCPGDPAEGDGLSLGALAHSLPPGDYHLDGDLHDGQLAAIAWALGAYRYDRYRKSASAEDGDAGLRCLQLPETIDQERVCALAEGVWLGRDLINTPANDLGPAELEAAARALAKQHDAKCSSIVGEDLLQENYPMIHAVGRASDRAPRLIDLTWGKKNAPKITLVGKGVCFDTGGLNIKPGSSMALMKKDMGGAAAVLALAHMIMATNMAVRLRVLIPAVENSISANAFRPGDILPSRKGLTVEIGNTDAEGRLVLADALALADEEEPEVMFSFATLTGAARVALGPDLPPLYSTNPAIADALVRSGMEVDDPLWQMPFWPRYDRLLASPVANVNHISNGGFAGSVIAALFLKRFVTKTRNYVHLDIFGWVPNDRPGRPKGGEPQGARSVFDYLSKRYS